VRASSSFGFSEDELGFFEFPAVKTVKPISTQKARVLIRKIFPNRQKAEHFCEYASRATFLEEIPDTTRAETAEIRSTCGMVKSRPKNSNSKLRSFTIGLAADFPAVRQAALSFDWSNGQLEGQINRLKTIKRIMYGRAKFDLLQNRVVCA